jgi:hypothetical protein
MCATKAALGLFGWNHLAWSGSNLKTPGAVLRNTEVTDASNPAIDGKLLRRVTGGWCRIYFLVIHTFYGLVRMLNSCCDGGQFQICLPPQITLPLAHDGLHMLYDCQTGLCMV